MYRSRFGSNLRLVVVATAVVADTLAAMGDTEFDPAEMQAAMARAGIEMTPEQRQKMQQAMAQIDAYREDPSTAAAAEPQEAEAWQREQRNSEATANEPAYESDYCTALHRYNAEKKTPIRESAPGSRVTTSRPTPR